MRCPSCNTELLHPANFCPTCGAPLGGVVSGVPPTPPSPRPVPNPVEDDNVVYLPVRGAQPDPPPHGSDAPADDPPPVHVHVDPETGQYVATPHLQHPTASSPDSSASHRHGPGDMPDPGTAPVLPSAGHGISREIAITSFFDDGPSPLEAIWRDEHHAGEPRIVGTMLVALSAATLVAAIVTYGFALSRGTAGAVAGGMVLVSAILWVWYLSLDDDQHHPSLLRRYRRLATLLDRRVDPLRSRTQHGLALRRERDRLRAMRDERTRRVTALGEAAYRRFRSGALDPELGESARRVLSMEQQMLLQDTRIRQQSAQRQQPHADGS